jgi:glycosyltransferase involved in cell wall biosynthesis
MRARVVHVITKLELGGAQQNTLYTVRHLDRARFEVALVTGTEGELIEEARAIPDCRLHLVTDLVREVAPVRDVRTLLALTRLLARERRTTEAPVIVHTHSSKAGILGRAAARLAGVPIVVHSIHGYGFHDGQRPAVRRLYVALERAAARWTDAFIAVAEENRRTGIALGLFPPERCEVIRSGIAIDAYRCRPEARAAARAALGVPPGAPLVGMIACLKPQKAPEDFVAVAARVRAALPEARFFLAGDGERRQAVEAAARAAGLDGAFQLLGWRRDVPELLAALDVLVLTSRWEGLPRVLPQAMAAGRPVVATNVNGAPEAVRDGVTGYLVPPGDIAGLADRVIALLRDPATREAMGRAARAAVHEFDATEMVRRQEALYGRLVADKAAGHLDRRPAAYGGGAR